jgi:hypothetical protein
MGYISYSQAMQDIFVLQLLKNKFNGVYIEVGANDPVMNSNTFVLENYYSWRGISFEINPNYVNTFNSRRKNKCICGDATKIDYNAIFKENNLPKEIDYLQLDIEPAEQTYIALTKIPFDDYRFSTITYEHDRYASGDYFMNLSRNFLNSKGYRLIRPNVQCNGNDFEDWWIDSNKFTEEIFSLYESKISMEFNKFLFIRFNILYFQIATKQ